MLSWVSQCDFMIQKSQYLYLLDENSKWSREAINENNSSYKLGSPRQLEGFLDIGDIESHYNFHGFHLGI